MNSLDSFLLGNSAYQIRHVNGRIVGATRLDIGRHVEPDELRTLAVRLGRWNALLGTVAATSQIGDDRRGGDE